MAFQVHIIECVVFTHPHALMEGWHMYRVTIGTPSKFGGDGYEFHTWCPPHVGPDDLEEFLRIHDKDPEV